MDMSDLKQAINGTSMPAMKPSALVQAMNEAAANAHTMSALDKKQIVESCLGLLSSAQTVEQSLMELVFTPIKTVAVRLAIDMHLFDIGTRALREGKTVTLQQLADETTCEALLIKRVIRILVQMKMFIEVDQDVFQPQPSVAAYCTASPVAQGVLHMTMTHLMQMFKLPDYFEEAGYQCPTEMSGGPFQYARNTKLHSFQWIAQHPREQNAFNVTMALRTRQLDDYKWFDVYPIEEALQQPSPSGVFAVELGGGMGFNMTSLKDRFMGRIPGRLVVQDTDVVTDANKNAWSGVELMTHDFFKSQPLRHANFYFCGHILHNWSDKDVKRILGHIKDAMGPDSVLLLNETIMPERGASFELAALDLMMMTAFSSLERTEEQFRSILDEVGLRLVRVWGENRKAARSGSFEQWVLEARLK